MDVLLVGLVIVDEMNDRRQMRQLANGWMGWESKSGRWLRRRGAHVLLAMAARVMPPNARPLAAEPPTLELPT